MPATVAAVSTPPGEGGIGVVRISGPSAFGVADGVFRSFSGKRVADIPGYTALYGRVYDGDEELDEAVALKFASPKSYTGEDVAEISCHGGAYVTGRVLRAVLRAGAEPAGPGEFTRRAYLNGKMDLTRAEAVADIIAADGDAALREALRAREGAVYREAERVKGMLLVPASRIAAYCDEPDEPEEFAGISSVESELSEAVAALDALLRGYESGKIRRRGASAVIAGKPNVGKSTLMNLLSGEERSIVTERAGTTRDVIEEAVNLGGVKLVLSDTAGLRDTPDPVERAGVRRAKEKLDGADIVLAVFDASRPFDAEDRAVYGLCRSKRHVLILNKADLLGSGGAADGVTGGVPGGAANLSAGADVSVGTGWAPGGTAAANGLPGGGVGLGNPLGGSVGVAGFPTGVGDFGGVPDGGVGLGNPLGGSADAVGSPAASGSSDILARGAAGAGGSPVDGNGSIGGSTGVGFTGGVDGFGGSFGGSVVADKSPGGSPDPQRPPGVGVGGAPDVGGFPGDGAGTGGFPGGGVDPDSSLSGSVGTVGFPISGDGANLGGAPGGTAVNEVNRDGVLGGVAGFPVEAVGVCDPGGVCGSSISEGGLDNMPGGANNLFGGAGGSAGADNAWGGLSNPQRFPGVGIGGAPDVGGFPGDGAGAGGLPDGMGSSLGDAVGSPNSGDGANLGDALGGVCGSPADSFVSTSGFPVGGVGPFGGAGGSAGADKAPGGLPDPQRPAGSVDTAAAIPSPANPYPALFGERAVAISAKEGRGLDELSRTVREALGVAGSDGDTATLCGERQYSCVARARDAACSALSALRGGVTLDAVGVLIGDALEPLLELTGERVSDEVTDEVFRRFCVGK